MRDWAGRLVLLVLGCAVGLAILEGALRAWGMFYRLRQEAANRVSLERGETYRILCLGESTTASPRSGADAYPAQLERILNERAGGAHSFSVINGGAVASTSDVILTRLPAMLHQFEPHIVVAMIGINDGPLADPAFRVKEPLRVFKLARMLYYHALSNRGTPTPAEASLLMRAEHALRSRPLVAAKLAGRAARLDPTDPRPHLVRAEALSLSGDGERALASYTRALERDPAAVLAYAHTVTADVGEPLGRALAGFPEEPNALAARATLALRSDDFVGASSLARKAIAIDPDNVFALLIVGATQEASGATAGAEATYRRAVEIDARLVKAIASRRPQNAPTLAKILSQSRVPARDTARNEGLEAWFVRDQETRRKNEERNSIDLWLMALRGRAERGEAGAAEDLLRLADSVPAEHQSFRLAALGHLAVLRWQAGDRAGAERYHRQLEEFHERAYNPVTQENYRKLARTLRDRGIQLVAVQYPMRSLRHLEQLVRAPDVVFVDNEQTFKHALEGRPYGEIFQDLFAGDFGHLTPLGNRLLAENVADAITTLITADALPKSAETKR